MENTDQNKSILFSNYLFQNVLMHNEHIKKPQFLWGSFLDGEGWLNNGYYLSLKRVINLTDEEAIEVAKLMYSFVDWIDETVPFVVKRFKELSSRDPAEIDVSFRAITMGETRGNYHLKIYDVGFYLGYETPNMLQSIPLHGYIRVIDYLRSKGYALPFRDISIEQQIEYGWIKIIEPSNEK